VTEFLYLKYIKKVCNIYLGPRTRVHNEVRAHRTTKLVFLVVLRCGKGPRTRVHNEVRAHRTTQLVFLVVWRCGGGGGKKLMDQIISQMNNNRLSNSGKPLINRIKLLEDITNLLSMPSNYEIRGDKV
jgi:hypothetical protein